MPLLFVDIHNRTRGAKLPQRVLIGRRSMNHLVIDDNAVSRMHAWIDLKGDDYVLTDMRSRTGTRVNGQPLDKRRKLQFGDVIEIGSAKITFAEGERVPMDVEPFELPREPVMLARDLGIRFDCPHCRAPMWASTQYAGHGGICTYCGEGFTIPRGVPPTTMVPPEQVQPAPQPSAPPKAPPVPERYDIGLQSLQAPLVNDAVMPTEKVFDAPPRREARAATPLSAEARATFADAFGAETETGTAVAEAEPPSIRHEPVRNAESFTLPDVPHFKTDALPTPKPQVTPSIRKKAASCGVCHSPIVEGEAATNCPKCSLHFHVECWHENYGCSAYGCPQVNALAPPEPEAVTGMEVSATEDQPTMDIPKPRTPWEFIFLGASALAVVASAFSFGAASVVTLVLSVVYLIRSKQDTERKTGAIWGAIALSVAGIAAGAAVSYFLFRYGSR